MPQCEQCGNEYDKIMEISIAGGEKHLFDSFECAAHALAPVCGQCACKVLGHGVEAGGTVYCCGHCAEHAGVGGDEARG